jgi:cysteine desulfurase
VLETMHKDTTHSPGFSIKGAAKEGRAAYLDFQATTPMDPRVVDAMVRGAPLSQGADSLRASLLMTSKFARLISVSVCLSGQLPFMVSSFGNPHSRTHAYGWEAEAAVENAREVRQQHTIWNSR